MILVVNYLYQFQHSFSKPLYTVNLYIRNIIPYP